MRLRTGTAPVHSARKITSIRVRGVRLAGWALGRAMADPTPTACSASCAPLHCLHPRRRRPRRFGTGGDQRRCSRFHGEGSGGGLDAQRHRQVAEQGILGKQVLGREQGPQLVDGKGLGCDLRPARQGVQAGAPPIGPKVGRALLQRPCPFNPDCRAVRVDQIAGHDLTRQQPDHVAELVPVNANGCGRRAGRQARRPTAGESAASRGSVERGKSLPEGADPNRDR
jgi:hypothetical protein